MRYQLTRIGPSKTLRPSGRVGIWTLRDIDRNGRLGPVEFAPDAGSDADAARRVAQAADMLRGVVCSPFGTVWAVVAVDADGTALYAGWLARQRHRRARAGRAA